MCTMDLLKDSCSEAMMRLAIFVLNALFLMVGVVFIVVGFLVEFEYSHFEFATGYKIGSTPAGLCLVGTFMIVISSLGIFGVMKKSKFLTGVYATLLIIILLAQICSIVIPIVATENAEGIIKKKGLETISKWDGPDGQISKSWDSIQNQLECCGVASYSDWKNATVLVEQAQAVNASASIPVPDSCCVEYSEFCGFSWETENQLKSEGCIVEIESFVKRHVNLIFGILGCIGFVELLAMVISFHLVSSGFTYESLA